MSPPVTYLRAVVTRSCNLACAYCHGEGDRGTRSEGELEGGLLTACLDAAARLGFRKFKFLGGEPLLRADLPEIVADLRRRAPFADLSVITAGVVPPRRLAALYAAGLSRTNVSIHGFTRHALARRVAEPRAWDRRAEFLAAVVAAGRPLKLNYVYGSVFDLDDLAALLAWAAPRRVLVNVLDDLHKDLSSGAVEDVVRRLRGEPDEVAREPDPDSLDTLRWRWKDGLEVEIKDRRLGDCAPWKACRSGPRRARCREGIVAVRLTHDGFLMPCMDRGDLRLPLAALIARAGEEAGADAWRRWQEAL